MGYVLPSYKELPLPGMVPDEELPRYLEAYRRKMNREMAIKVSLLLIGGVGLFAALGIMALSH